MKPDYKNWIPKGMLVSLIAGTVLFAVGFSVMMTLDVALG